MIELKDWISTLKNEKVELREFIEKIEKFISEKGFEEVDFEKAVNTGLQKKEEEIKNTFKTNAQN